MDVITAGLKPSAKALEITRKIMESDNLQVMANGLKTIVGGISNYDDYQLAGRLKIRELVMSISSMEIYLLVNDHLFNDTCKRFMHEHIDELNEMINKSEVCNYHNQDYFSSTMLEKMYLLKSIASKKPTETPVLHNLRLAVQMYHDDSIERIQQAFDEMNNSYYTHATPTKIHAGKKDCQMSSCFLMEVDDNLDSMMYTGWGDMGMISRYSGGIGISLNKIRHSDIAGTGDSAGVMPYARVCDKAIGYVDQSRTRRGAATGYLNVWHIDIEDFIVSPSNTLGEDIKVKSLTPCIWTHDLFFERCRNNELWTLFCPNKAKSLIGKYGEDFEHEYIRLEALAPAREQAYIEADAEYDRVYKQFTSHATPSEELKEEFTRAVHNLAKTSKERIVHKEVTARSIMLKIVDTQLKSGKPYVMNGDRCNAKSNQQNIGPINCSNLCVEIVQYSDSKTFSSCNLASINLPIFAKNRFNHDLFEASDEEIMKHLTEVYDFEHLGIITQSVVENLNKVIQHNFYPFDSSKIKDFNMDTRPLGIGVSGLDDCFKVLDLVYGDRVSIILNKMIFGCMYYNALVKSYHLTEVYGEYKRFRTGSCHIFDPDQQTMVEHKGSPLSNGFFQFDLWDREYHYDLSKDRINHEVYDPKDNVPIDPKYFGENLMSWEELREEIREHGVVNSLLIALMPTASTAQILRNAETVEAHQSNMYSRQLAIGSFRVINRHLYKDMEELGLLDDDFVEFLYNNAGKMDGYADYYLSKVTSFKQSLSTYKKMIDDLKKSRKYLTSSLCHGKEYPAGIENTFEIIDGMSYSNVPDPRSISEAFDGKVDEIYRRLKYLEKKYQTMFDIPYQTWLKMARQRGIYVDQSQSTNVYARDPPLKELAEIQMYAYDNKIKTHIYYLRNEIASSKTGFNKSVKSIQAGVNKEPRENDRSLTNVPSVKSTTRSPMRNGCNFPGRTQEEPECVSCVL